MSAFSRWRTAVERSDQTGVAPGEGVVSSSTADSPPDGLVRGAGEGGAATAAPAGGRAGVVAEYDPAPSGLFLRW